MKNLKKQLVFLLALVMIFSSVANVSAYTWQHAEEIPRSVKVREAELDKNYRKEFVKYIFTIGSNSYQKVTSVGVETRQMDVVPYIKNQRTMLPLRYVGEAISASVDWNQITRIASFTKEELKAKIQIDNNKIFMSNGMVYTMDTKPDNINGRILAPITNVASVYSLTNGDITDGIDHDIEWDGVKKTVTIYLKKYAHVGETTVEKKSDDNKEDDYIRPHWRYHNDKDNDNRTVKKDADKYTPIIKNLSIKIGDKPKAEDAIINKDKLPKGTKYEWKEKLDTTKSGQKDVAIVVTYPDGSKEEATIKVVVTDPKKPAQIKLSVADLYEGEKGILITTNPEEATIVVYKDGVEIRNLITNNLGAATIILDKDMVKGEKYIIKAFKDGYLPNEITMTVEKSLSDADKYTPTIENLNKELGTQITEDEVIAKVTTNYPKDAAEQPKITVKDSTKLPDGTKESTTPITVVIEYPDGSKEEVIVNVVIVTPKLQLVANIDKVYSNSKDINIQVIVRNAKAEVFKSEFDWSTYKTVLTPLGEATSMTRFLIVSLKETLPKGTNLFIRITHPNYSPYESSIIVE